MELVHGFSVPVPVEQAWPVLTDVARIAPCLPGAELTGSDGDAYQGVVKVKVGPITAQYRGTASFAEKDESKHRVVLKAAGRDTRGQGTASATVTARPRRRAAMATASPAGPPPMTKTSFIEIYQRSRTSSEQKPGPMAASRLHVPRAGRRCARSRVVPSAAQ